MNIRSHLLLFWIGFSFSACASRDILFDQYVANTSSTYTESRVLFLENTSSDADLMHQKQLLHPYEVLHVSSDQVTAFRHGDPLTVVVSGVWLPVGLRGEHDIVVLVDVATGEGQEVEPIVVFYQRAVPGGQLLAFANLTVYSDPLWNSDNPPFFRVRVLDLGSDIEQQTQHLLSQSSLLPQALGGMLPHSLNPIVQVAMQAASAVLGDRQNDVLLDYQVQFYENEQVRASGADLAPLRVGEWIAVGRPPEQTAAFWSTRLWVHRGTGIISDEAGQEIDSPYIRLALLREDLNVPTLVMNRSAALLKLFTTSSGKDDYDGLEKNAELLRSSIEGYIAEGRLKRFRTMDALSDVINLVKGDDPKSPRRVLTPTTRYRLLSLVNDVTGQEFSVTNPAGLDQWWRDNYAKGRLVSDPSRRHGIRLVLSQ